MTSGPIPPLPPRSTRRAAAIGQSKSKVRAVLKLVGIPVLILVLAGLIYITYTYRNVEDTLDRINTGTDEKVPREELAEQKPVSILLLGLDSRPETGTLNTDVIMVAALNPKDKSAVIVSIPRDTYVKVDGWRARKANAFYAVVYNENKETALSEIRPIFSDFLDVPIDYTVVINFRAFTDLVDELGGITVNVDQDMYYVDPTDGTHIDLKAGVQTLNGDQALDFVRYRHSNNGETPESSDLERNKRQQAVLSAIIDKLKPFNAIAKANSILNVIGDNVRTDIPKQQMKSLIMTYAAISNDKIQYIPLEGVWQSPYVYLDEAGFEQAKMVLKRQLGLEVAPAASAPTAEEDVYGR